MFVFINFPYNVYLDLPINFFVAGDILKTVLPKGYAVYKESSWTEVEINPLNSRW